MLEKFMEEQVLKKIFSLILAVLIMSPCCFATTSDTDGTYVPPEGYGSNVESFMYQNYRRDESNFKDEDDEDYAMPLPKFLQRKKEENAKKMIPHEIKKNSDGKMKQAPMSFGQFPQNYDSNQQMFMMQNQMQQMFNMPF